MSWLHHLASHKTRKQDNIAFIHTASTVQTSLRHPADMCIHIHAQKTVRKDTPTPYLCSGVISRLQKMGQLRNALCQRPRPLPVLLPIRTARLWLLQTKLQVFVHTHTHTKLAHFHHSVFQQWLSAVSAWLWISTLLSEKVSPSRFG